MTTEPEEVVFGIKDLNSPNMILMLIGVPLMFYGAGVFAIVTLFIGWICGTDLANDAIREWKTNRVQWVFFIGMWFGIFGWAGVKIFNWLKKEGG